MINQINHAKTLGEIMDILYNNACGLDWAELLTAVLGQQVSVKKNTIVVKWHYIDNTSKTVLDNLIKVDNRCYLNLIKICDVSVVTF